MIVTLVLLLLGILFMDASSKIRNDNKYPNEPPIYPGAWPVVGHVASFLRGRKIVCNPEDCLMIANKCISKGRNYSMVTPWVGECLLTSDEAVWRKDRKFLTPAYNTQLLESFLDTFNTESRRMVENIAREADKASFDYSPYMKEYAISTICNIVFGDFDEKKKYMHTVELILHILTKKLFNLMLQVESIYKWTDTKKIETRCINFFHDSVDDIIKKKRLQMERKESVDTGSKETVIDLLLKSQPENVMSDVQLRDHVNMTIAAGFDTLAASMPLVLVMIGSHADVQDKIYKEIIDVVGTNRDVRKADLSRLVYLTAVINESLRVLPLVPIVARKVEQDIQLRDYTLYAGHTCVLFLRGLNLNPAWGADVEEFKPERWLQPNLASNCSAGFAAFSVGTRNCLGKTYAMTSMKTMLVHLIRKYTVAADWTKIHFGQDALSRADSGHHISLKERQKFA